MAFAPTKQWKLPYITHWDDSRNQNPPIDSAKQAEQDHRGVKQRYYPMLGFGAFPSAKRFCQAFEEVRQYFPPRRKRKQVISLAQRRRRFVARARVLKSMFLAA